MRAILILFFLACFNFIGISQNCEYFKSLGDTIQAEACFIAEGAQLYYQFSKEYQRIYDSSIEKCPTFATAYHAKSVAYLKSGDFINWKVLIDKAVELNPSEYLSNRGWCRFKFIRDYEGAIKDIEQLENIINYDIGYSSDGAYHLAIAKALCHKQLGNHEIAIEIIQSKLAEEDYMPGLYDYFHLGVLYLETNEFEKSINSLKKQIKLNANAESFYYLSIAYKELNNKSAYSKSILKAKELYSEGSYMTNSYISRIDKIYLKEILEEIETGI